MGLLYMTITKESTKKGPSKELRIAIDEIVGSFQKTAVLIDRVFTIGRNEGFNDIEIGIMIKREMLAAKYDPRTIRRSLPPSAKHSEKVREQKTFADKLSANEHENKVSILTAQKSDNDLQLYTHKTLDVEPNELSTTERQQSVTGQSKNTVQERREFGIARISMLPEDSGLLKFEIPISKAVLWQFVEDHLGEAYNHFWINGVMNLETGKILSLAMEKGSIT
jgi:hypothetical protein